MSSNYITDSHGIRRYLVTINVNGIDYTRVIKANVLLANFLREELDLTGTKKGCEIGDCGSCTVLLNDKPVNSCLVLALECDGMSVTTVEGLATTSSLDIIQEKFLEFGAIQCGYCSAGMIMSAKALLMKNPKPTEEEVRKGISGNLCRCTGYINIIKAILSASGQEVPN
ncbi:MAG: (2Fe-2S)-binding protein [Peptococcaceae bacterium]|nr:(2Fe-2S)-binding protein [Peptococcaceae bacterium]